MSLSPTLLVVEDSPSELELISYFLAQGGYRIVTAANGKDAYEIALKENPDVIVTDVVMPIMSGFELCRLLKKNPQTKNLPIIICSSKTLEIDRIWGLRQGANIYLTKPFTRDNLLNAVKSLVNKY